MSDERTASRNPVTEQEAVFGKPLSPQARRALAEAEERRKVYAEQVGKLPKEIGGRNGPEPGRYGDWEVKGLASDF
jgi:hypothetical protein